MPCRAMNPDSLAVSPKHLINPSGLGLTGISIQGGKLLGVYINWKAGRGYNSGIVLYWLLGRNN